MPDGRITKLFLENDPDGNTRAKVLRYEPTEQPKEWQGYYLLDDGTWREFSGFDTFDITEIPLIQQVLDRRA